MKIDSVSYAVASKVVKNFAMSVSRIRGQSTANAWLQVHDAKALPANGAVPKRSFQVFLNAPFDVMLADDDLDCLNGCVLAMSSTEATLTISASTMSLFVTGTSHIDDTDWTVVGDYTTAAETQPVWNDAAGPKKLMRLEVSDAVTGSGPFYVQLFAGDSALDNTLQASFLVEFEGTLDIMFGNGLNMVRQVAGVTYDGCFIALSSTQSVYTELTQNADYIRASYAA